MKLFRLLIIVFAVAAGGSLYIYQDFKDTNAACQFYIEKGSYLNQPSVASLPAFLENLAINASQTSFINEFKSAHYDLGKISSKLRKNFDFASLIDAKVLDSIIAEKSPEPLKLNIDPKSFLHDSLAASQKGRRFYHILVLHGIFEADEQRPGKALNLLHGALKFLPQAYLTGDGMFFGAITRIQSLLDIIFWCRSINQACYLTDFDEYSVSLLLEGIKSIDNAFPPVKEVLLQYRSLPRDFAQFFTNLNISKNKEQQQKFQKILLALASDAEAFFDQNYAKFTEIAAIEFEKGKKLGKEFSSLQETLYENFKNRFSLANLLRNPIAYRQHFAAYLTYTDAPPYQSMHEIVWKTRQQLEGTRTILALEAYKSRHKQYPDNLQQLNDFFNQLFGNDLYTGTELQYASEPLKLSSAGPDKMHGSSDDVRIFPETDL